MPQEPWRTPPSFPTARASPSPRHLRLLETLDIAHDTVHSSRVAQRGRRGGCRSGSVVGARSGDKGGDANLGVWARTDAGYAWLRGFLTVAELKGLLPECAPLDVDRYELPNLRALNFVIHGLLGEGVAASTRFDPQAKALSEWLRSRVVDVPEELL